MNVLIYKISEVRRVNCHVLPLPLKWFTKNKYVFIYTYKEKLSEYRILTL